MSKPTETKFCRFKAVHLPKENCLYWALKNYSFFFSFEIISGKQLEIGNIELIKQSSKHKVNTGDIDRVNIDTVFHSFHDPWDRENPIFSSLQRNKRHTHCATVCLCVCNCLQIMNKIYRIRRFIYYYVLFEKFVCSPDCHMWFLRISLCYYKDIK